MTATTIPFAAFSDALADIVAAASHSVVEIQSHRSLATGFIWRDGLVVTPDETLAEEGRILVEGADGSVCAAKLVGRDPATDIALLRVEGILTPASPAVGLPVRPGALALIVAAAESTPLVVFGSVAVAGPAWQSMRGGTIDARIEIDVRLRRRAEGGLAIDARGGAFGMAVRGPRGRTLVIPSATIERVAGQRLEHGRMPIAYLGAGLQDVPLDDGGRGAMVMSLDADGRQRVADCNRATSLWPGAATGFCTSAICSGTCARRRSGRASRSDCGGADRRWR